MSLTKSVFDCLFQATLLLDTSKQAKPCFFHHGVTTSAIASTILISAYRTLFRRIHRIRPRHSMRRPLRYLDEPQRIKPKPRHLDPPHLFCKIIIQLPLRHREMSGWRGKILLYPFLQIPFSCWHPRLPFFHYEDSKGCVGVYLPFDLCWRAHRWFEKVCDGDAGEHVQHQCMA